MDPRLRQLALGAGGVFTRRDAFALAMTDNDLRALCRREAVRAGRGGYMLRDVWDRASPEGRFALTARATARALGPGVTVSHHAALALHGLPLFGVDTGVVDVLCDISRVRTRGRLRRHPQDGSTTLTSFGVRVASLECALAQTLLASGPVAATVPADAALHRELVTLDRLEAEVRRRTAAPEAARHPKARRALELWLATVEPVAESVGETRTRLLLHDLGFAQRPQVQIRDARGNLVARVDFLVEEGTVVEFDGLVKYEGLEGKQALATEKRREEALRRLGYGIVRLIWSDLTDPAHVRRLVEQERGRPQTGRSAA